MNYGQNLFPTLITLGSYTSPPGGSGSPHRPQPHHLLFEIIQEGTVYGFEEIPVLYGEGTVFCHYGDQYTVSESPLGSYYGCLVTSFECHSPEHAASWPRCFQWKDLPIMNRFADEMLYAFHQTTMSHTTIGNLIWTRLRFEQEQFQSQEKLQIHPQLRSATDFINTHYREALSLENIAEAASISVSHLHMLFRKYLHESPHQYLIQKRMRVASHTLATSELPIKAIAAEVGYINTENFCRAFRQFSGRSASEYRQAYTRAQVTEANL